MAVRDVLRYPDRALKTAAPPARLDSADLARAARDLLDTMRSFGHCVGLAAPQISEPIRVIAVDVTGHPKAATSNGLLLLANPRVIESSGAAVAREGCLSIPHLTANVRRATEIAVEADALELGEGELGAEPRLVESEGFEARCLLHEIDHLDGILFLDRVDSLARDVFQRKRYG